MPSLNTLAAPFVKWAGGKSQILNEIRKRYPQNFGGQINKYAEPFVGGGAVLFDALNRFGLREAYISDVNRELIHTYRVIRDAPGDLISVLADLEHSYNASGADRSALYYSARLRFNRLKLAGSAGVELAGLFIFLNHTCYNGLYRVNRKGEYNVPMGRYINPRICDADNLWAVSEKLQNVTIVCGDYKLSGDFIDDRTFVYFDPPYRPLSSTAGFTAYTETGFGDTEQVDLARFIDEIAAKGAFFLVSNSDPKNSDGQDEFFDRLYQRHTIMRIEAARPINSAASGRGRVSELLIVGSYR